MRNPLMDKDFLLQLDRTKEKEVYARVIVLDFSERPLEQIEGRVTQGSINVDGTSAVRRTCSLSLIAEQLDINNFYWGLNNKFKLEVGLKNDISTLYPDIIWFPQGLYVFTSLNISQELSSFNVSISGKDKMCLLNGDISGSLSSSVDFGTLEEYEYNYVKMTFDTLESYEKDTYYLKETSGYVLSTGDYDSSKSYYRKEQRIVYTNIPLKTIIKNAVNVYGNEPIHNIIINDLEDFGVELLEYRGDSSLYLLRDINADIFRNMSINGAQKCYTLDGTETSLNSIAVYDTLNQNASIIPTQVRLELGSKNIYTVVKLDYGTTAGYRLTDLTYAGDLIANIGESITSVLDKIVSMLGNFEYFYDLDGRFVFQKQRTYTSNSWNSIINTEGDSYIDAAAYTSAITYTFEDGVLITSFQNAPNLQNLKNDFSIWGKRTTVSGGEVPIHLRYVIADKPTYYRSITVPEGIVVNGKAVTPQVGVEYSTSTLDWREIIYQMAKDYFQYNHVLDDFIYRVAAANYMYYPSGYTGYEQYYTDLQGFWRQLYDPTVPSADYNSQTYWHVNVDKYPELLNFWFDFLDSNDTELGKYKINIVGNRPKAINDSNVSAIYFRDTPTVLFVTYDEYNKMVEAGDLKTGYTYIQLKDSMQNYFSISPQGVSAQDKLDDLLYNNTYCIESINIAAIPIYYLEPNTRIFVKDNKSKINGEYIVSKISLPLTFNGTMQITATKAVAKIY